MNINEHSEADKYSDYFTRWYDKLKINKAKKDW